MIKKCLKVLKKRNYQNAQNRYIVQVEKGILDLLNKIEEIRDRSQEAEETTVRTGWLGNSMSGRQRLSEIAKVLNYGRSAGINSSGHRYPAIPPRPFMDLYFDKHFKNTRAMIKKAVQTLISGNLSQAIAMVGSQSEAGLKKAMKDPIWQTEVPNSPVTIKAWAQRHAAQIKRNRAARRRRGEEVSPILQKQPLTDTGHLIQSIHWDVKKK